MIPAQHALPARVHECTAAQIAVRLGAGEGAAGTIYVAIVFTNTSRVACSLRGYPGVSSVGGADGHRIGAPARRDPPRGATVILRPGGVASAAFGQSEALNYPRSRCQPEPARGLRIYAPDQTRARSLVYKHLACSVTTAGDSSISTLVRGANGVSAS
jgi:hypothetical protein